ncbi:BREX-1 system adenine-specific DNA-methyltransferase PglX [Bacillus paranthracis]|uniref:BREX-1 system adenine-specific DNA-methyltransferase PglX n=1 Tax=Bacillus paranthracis TaxID=2026186 RepID=UPI003014EFE5
MNKKALKEFAVYARNELREQIALRAQAFGITSEGSPVLVTGADYVEINGKKYPTTYKNSIQKLLKEIEIKGYDNVIEEVAYTWFNRLIAIRYMEVHNYLPSKVRVLSSETKGKVDPDILSEYQYTDLPVNKEEVASLLAQGNREEAFRKLLVAQCNELNGMMDFLFEKLADYTELLLPESLLHADSLINKLGKEVEDANFEHVEVIGWLYQYYISERKDEVFAGLKKNKKITKENIPAATQLFTPHWIVRYMVENSLGHMWLESYPESELKADMKYYVEPAEQESEVQAKLEELRKHNLSPEEITIMDPACGSGHILVYAFDLLYKIYEERGYPTKEIPALILEKNLYGIDIDDRAAQLASFALMMKAREKTKRIFRNIPKLNVISIQETNSILIEQAADLIGENDNEKEEVKKLLITFIDAKNFGSILQSEKLDFDKYIGRIRDLKETGEHTLENFEVYGQLEEIEGIIEQASRLASDYDIVITNPPYMGTKGMNVSLSQYLKMNFTNTKSDLFAVFMERMEAFTKINGYHVSVTMQSWMFLSSFEKYRKHLISNYSILNMVHMANMVMGIAFGTCSTIIRKTAVDFKGTFQYMDLPNIVNNEPVIFPIKDVRYGVVNGTEFNAIPGSPIAYWATSQVRKIFLKHPLLEKFAEPRQGLATSDNNRFVRIWHEVGYSNVGYGYACSNDAKESDKKWFPYNKGGDFRKWYGNQECVINWKNDGEEVKGYAAKLYKSYTRTIKNIPYYFREGITWSFVSSSKFGVRHSPEGFIFDVGGSSAFPDKEYQYYLTSFLVSKVAYQFLQYLNPTLNYQVGNIKTLPIVLNESFKHEVDKLAKENISISKCDWDSFEISWNFLEHPFRAYSKQANLLEDSYKMWEIFSEKQFLQVKQNERELNKIFIELYGLQDELTPEVPDQEVTIRRADRVRDTKSFLSYCIGLMMGRYSLDVEGLAYAGGEWDASKYKTFQPDSDGIIPLTDTEYFEDDVVTRLQELLVIMFGQDTLADNLRWLAESLIMKNNETPVERLRRYFFDEFYSDHCKIYQKRPIYWMADSGKKKGFRALFYLHRYTPETLATMRFSYLQNLQEKLSQEQKRLEQDLVNPDLTAAMKKRYNKQLTTIKAQQDELIDFDKKMAELANQRIALDLDDGVVVNYKKIESVLAKIK